MVRVYGKGLHRHICRTSAEVVLVNRESAHRLCHNSRALDTVDSSQGGDSSFACLRLRLGHDPGDEAALARVVVKGVGTGLSVVNGDGRGLCGQGVGDSGSHGHYARGVKEGGGRSNDVCRFSFHSDGDAIGTRSVWLGALVAVGGDGCIDNRRELRGFDACALGPGNSGSTGVSSGS